MSTPAVVNRCSLTSAAGGGGGGGARGGGLNDYDAFHHPLLQAPPSSSSSSSSPCSRGLCLRCSFSPTPSPCTAASITTTKSRHPPSRTLSPCGLPKLPSLIHHHRQQGAQPRTAPAATLRVFSVTQVKWILEPIGDGDCKHLNEAVPLPEAIELTTDVATLGRVPEKADIVLPIATVSGAHARIERKGGVLFVTDLGSTNGTYINDKPIRAGGSGTPAPPGSRITFGDDHLAAFKFSIVEVEAPIEIEKLETVDLQDVDTKQKD